MTNGGGEESLVEAFKEVMSHRAGGVAVIALRDDGDVYATTVTSFISVSAEPPRILVSLTGNAQVLPFLSEGKRFAVSLLRAEQRKIASVYADSYPVGPSPFPPGGDPLVAGSLAALVCTVEQVYAPEGARLVLGGVVGTTLGESGRPLIHFRRTYRTLE